MVPSHSALKRPAADLPFTAKKPKGSKLQESPALVKTEPKSQQHPKPVAPKGLPKLPQSEGRKMHQKLKQKGDSNWIDKYQ